MSFLDWLFPGSRKKRTTESAQDRHATKQEIGGSAIMHHNPEPSHEQLMEALNETNPNAKCRAIQSLGKARDSRSVQQLIEALSDANEFVRMDAACALGQIADSRAVKPLIHALRDAHGFVRREAALALGELADIKAAEPLIAVLEDSLAGAAAAKSLYKITGLDQMQILMSGKDPKLVYRQVIQKLSSNNSTERRSDMSTVSIGDVHVGYKVVALKKSTVAGHVSIILAEKVSDSAPTQFVVWAFDHSVGGFRNGIYKNDRAEAQKDFESRTS